MKGLSMAAKNPMLLMIMSQGLAQMGMPQKAKKVVI
jgi:hypothetical protein